MWKNSLAGNRILIHPLCFTLKKCPFNFNY